MVNLGMKTPSKLPIRPRLRTGENFQLNIAKRKMSLHRKLCKFSFFFALELRDLLILFFALHKFTSETSVLCKGHISVSGLPFKLQRIFRFSVNNLSLSHQAYFWRDLVSSKAHSLQIVAASNSHPEVTFHSLFCSLFLSL